MGFTTFSYWSLPLRRLPELVLPGFLGRIDTLPVEVHFWGHNIIDQGIPYILSIYFGWVTLVLALIGGLRKDNENNPVFPFRARIFLLALFVFSLLFALGRFLPFFHALYQYVPMITLFRHPIKVLTAGILPLALLAGYGSELLFGESRFTSQRKVLILLWSITGIIGILTLTFLLSDNFATRFQGFFFKHSAEEIAHRGVQFSLLHAFAIGLLVALLYQYRRLQARPWQHWMLAGIVAVDLLVAGEPINPSAPAEFFTEEPASVQIVHREIGEGRLFRTKSSSDYTVSAPSDNIVWFYRWNLEILNSYLAAFYRLPVIFHGDLDRLAQVYIVTLKNVLDTLDWERRLPLLSAGGVTVILTSDDFSLPGVQRIASIPNRSTMPLYLYRNETAAARIEFVTSWKVFHSDAEALEALLSPNSDPRQQVVLQIPESTLFERYSETPEIPATDSGSSECTQRLQIKNQTSNTHSASFVVSNQCDGYLVFSEPFYPGWRVYVDGERTPILRANYAFSAVFLKAGEHEVERRYRPNSLLYGVLSTVMFCGLLWVVMLRLKIED